MYIESGRRCRRSGTGDPAICNAHRVAFMEASRRGAKPRGARAVGDGVYDLFERLMTGKKVTQKVAREAFKDARDIINEFAQGESNGYAAYAEQLRQRINNARQRVDPEAAARAARAAQKKRAEAMARQVLGFAPQDPLTAEIINRRRRELARRHHPDHGGSDAKMKEINGAVDVLLEGLVP